MKKRRLKIQTICGVGMGSSLMAKITIEKVAKEMNIEVEVECAQPAIAGGPGIDIIATTPFLADKLGNTGNIRIVQFSNFVDTKHIRGLLEPVFKELLGELS